MPHHNVHTITVRLIVRRLLSSDVNIVAYSLDFIHTYFHPFISHTRHFQVISCICFAVSISHRNSTVQYTYLIELSSSFISVHVDSIQYVLLFLQLSFTHHLSTTFCSDICEMILPAFLAALERMTARQMPNTAADDDTNYIFVCWLKIVFWEEMETWMSPPPPPPYIYADDYLVLHL